MRSPGSRASASTHSARRGAISIALRAIPFQVCTIDDLGLPEVVRKLADQRLGIVRDRRRHRTFARAMRRVLRQDPDVILIREMREEETVRTALSAAEIGHLVMSTLHTLDATEPDRAHDLQRRRQGLPDPGAQAEARDQLEAAQPGQRFTL